jgi:hypothetical protein
MIKSYNNTVEKMENRISELANMEVVELIF